MDTIKAAPREKTSLELLDSVPATPSPPSVVLSPSLRPRGGGGVSMDLSSSSSSSSPFAPIEPESLSSTPQRSTSTSNLPSALGHVLTSNTSFYDIPMTDAFTELLERYVPMGERPERQQQQQQPPLLLNLDDTKPDGLATMVMNHHWRSVARDARQKLVQTSPTDLDTIFQLWYIRLLALYQLGLYQLASAEFEKLVGHGGYDLFPFDLRVLWAILPSQLGHPLLTLERLSSLAIQQQQLQQQQQQQREWQVYFIMVTQLIQMNDAHGAAKILQAVLHRVTAMAPESSNRLDLLTSLGRLYLQLGDLGTAEQMYTEMETIQQQSPALDTPSLQEIIQTNRALLCMAKGDWMDAKHRLEQVIQHHPENLTAVNNLAVCMVYTDDLTQATNLLNRTIQLHPTTAGTSQVTVMNLCTLYELRFDGAGLINKKVDVMKQIARWVGDSFHPQCIKLQ